MKRKIKEKRGITLVSLVVTIIVLLILSAVSVAMLTGENGIFKTAQKAKIESQKADYRETIELSKVEEGINKKLNRTKKEKLEGIYNILRNGEKFKKDVDSSKASMELIDNDELEPRIVIKTKEGWKYTVTVDGIIEGEIPSIDLEKADIKIEIEPTSWTNEDVEVVSIKVQNEEYKENKIQYSYDLKTWRDYKDTEKIKITENKKIYARLANGLSISDKYATGNITNIDKKEAEISTTMNSSNVTTKGFTVNVGVKDENSGLGKIVWYYKKSDATSYTSEEVIYKELHSIQAGETTAVTKSKTYDNLTSETYNVYAEIYDVAGNITNANSSDKPLEITLNTVTPGTITGAISFSTPTWSGGKASTTISTNTGYTIQYQVNSTTENWTTGTNVTGRLHGDIIYARLTDGVNAGTYASLTIKDEEQPTITLSSGGITISRTCVLTVSASDAKSGLANYKIYVNGNVVATNSNYTIPNMEFNKTYTCYAIATDNAGNTKQSSTITLKNEVYIATLKDLSNFRNTVNSGNSYSGKTVIQTSDIDLQCSISNQWTPIGNQTNAFSGTYDGNNKKISNIYIDNLNDFQGLFGVNNGVIKNTNLISGKVKGRNYIGGIAGKVSKNGNIIKCYNNAQNIGAITGNYEKDQNPSIFPYIGGIVGNNCGIIKNCFNNGIVTVDMKTNTSGNAYTGGIAGRNEKTVDSCYNGGSIKGGSTRDGVSGGIVASNVGTVSNSYNLGNVEVKSGKNGNDFCSGIVGYNRKTGIIINTYNIGTIVGGNIRGGISQVYSNLTGTVNNSYYLNTCGAAGLGTSKTSAQLKGLAGTLGSAFKNDTNNINGGYPILSWQ